MDDYFEKIDILYEKSDLGLDYDLLQKIVENVINQYMDIKIEEYNEFFSLTDILEIVLGFAKSLGDDYYNFITKTLFSNKIILFEKSDISNYDIVDINGFPLKNTPSMYYNDNETDYRIYIPITNTIEDIFTIVHEITHVIEINSNDKLAKSIFIEISSLTMEKILSNYLTENNISKKEVKKHDINNHNSIYYDALDSLYAITFTNIKKKLGKINTENFQRYTDSIYYFREYIDTNDVKKYIDSIKKNDYTYLFKLRYIIAQLVSINLISSIKDNNQILKIISDFNNTCYTKESAEKLIINGITNNEIEDKLKILQINLSDINSTNNVFNNYKAYTRKLLSKDKCKVK